MFLKFNSLSLIVQLLVMFSPYCENFQVSQSKILLLIYSKGVCILKKERESLGQEV